MTRLADAAVSAAVTGTVAAIFTTVALGLLARAEGRPPLAPVNASGHWLHGEGAGKGGRADIAHTGTGLATNHLASIFWALPFEWRLAGKEAQTPGAILREAASMAAIAAAVDYGLMPKRLTPGWENDPSLPPSARWRSGWPPAPFSRRPGASARARRGRSTCELRHSEDVALTREHYVHVHVFHGRRFHLTVVWRLREPGSDRAARPARYAA
jgi:hypothetical protein